MLRPGRISPEKVGLAFVRTAGIQMVLDEVLCSCYRYSLCFTEQMNIVHSGSIPKLEIGFGFLINP